MILYSNAFKRLALRLLVAGCGCLALNGCASPAQDHSLADLQKWTADRTGQTLVWRAHDIGDRRADAAVDALLRRPLTVSAAVQIALLNNRSMQVALEELAISHADLVQAGLLQNPVFFASPRFPNKAPGGTDSEFSVEQDFLDILVLPLRKKVAAADFQRVKLGIGQQIMVLSEDVEIAVYTAVARQQLLDEFREVEESARAAAELARRQFDAGALNELGLVNQQIALAQARLEVTGIEAQLDSDRERLNRLLGLSSAQAAWVLDGTLPEIAGRESPQEPLQQFAIQRRFDLQSARAQIESLSQAVSLTRGFRYFAKIDVGIDTERMTDGQRVTGPVLSLQIPIFDQGQARVGKAEAMLRQAQDRYMAMVVDVTADVREAAARLLASRSMVSLANALLHQRRHMIDLTLQQYNGMLKGTYDLLDARRNAAEAERAYIEAERDYWIARVQLERAVGGKWAGESTQPSGDAK